MQTQDQQSQQPAETAATEVPETQTLEDIARELSVEEQAQQFASSTQPQYQPQYQPPSSQQEFRAPDPVTDPEGYNRFVQQWYQQNNQITGTVGQLQQRLEKFERTQLEQRIDQDVGKAVSKVNEKLNVDPFLAEALLEMTYKKDVAFKKIWDNRERNPQALDRALSVLSGKLAGQVQFRQDPKIAANLRAAKSAQQTMATTQQQDQNSDVPQGEAEFQQYWRRLISGG